MAPAMSCADSEELLALAALGVLTRGEGAPLDEHLSWCGACRRAALVYRDAAGMFADAVEPAQPPASMRVKLMRVAYAEEAPAPAPSRRRRVRWSLPRARMLSLVGGAVTAAAVAVALIAVLHPANSMRTYTVLGTTSVPAVRGTLTYSSEQHQAVMTLSGLPQPVSVAGAPPQVYEVWLVRANGSAQAVGFLEQAPPTSSWSTVIDADLSRFVAVAATAEPAGGSPEPTGPQLLSVQVTS